jgi:hypothetical protein
MLATLADPTVTADPNAFFFGYIGVACALVFASNEKKYLKLRKH